MKLQVQGLKKIPCCTLDNSNASKTTINLYQLLQKSIIWFDNKRELSQKLFFYSKMILKNSLYITSYLKQIFIKHVSID